MGKEYTELNISPDLASLLNLEADDLCPVAIGNKIIRAVIEVGDDSKERLITVSPELAMALGIPQGLDLNIRKDGEKLRLGPLVGIMTSAFNRQLGSFGSQNTFFKGLVISLENLHGLGYIFTPQDINWQKNRIHGYYLLPAKSKWQQKWFPFPDVCYNRYFKHSQTTSPGTPVSMARLQGRTKTFNTSIGSKISIHQQLSREAGISPHLPDTHMFSSSNLLNVMLNKYREVYIKPLNGSKGQGITRVTKKNNRYLVKASGNAKLFSYLSLGEAISTIRSLSPGRQFLIQQAIKVRGVPHFDFRVMVQKNRHNHWTVTGIAARVASHTNITTNLHTGGHAVSLQHILTDRGFSLQQISSIQEEMEYLAMQIAQCIGRNSRLIGELGLDFIIDSQGKIWFLEANPKPARHSFTMIDKNLRSLTVSRPMEYACYLAGF